MSRIGDEYQSLFENQSDFPVSLDYGSKSFRGFDPACFREISRSEKHERNGVVTTRVFMLDEIRITLETGFYEKYDAYDWRIFFTNTGTSQSHVFRNVSAADLSFTGAAPRVKGILGDYDNDYRPYDYDLSCDPVNFVSSGGRSCHGFFPYFNLETDDGSAMLAIGWGGTWSADFIYSGEKNSTRFKGTGCINFASYLKPGETFRTPLMGVVRTFTRDEDEATNAWRRWVVECNLPEERPGVSLRPYSTTCCAFDVESSIKYKTDGSTCENHTTWRKTMEEKHRNGVETDIHWFDAGWYISPKGETIEKDWWGNVGTWTLDHFKWPGNTFDEYVQFEKQRGTMFMVWFEPDRVTHIPDLVKNFGYKAEWSVRDRTGPSVLNNLAIPECLEWTAGKVIGFMNEHDIDIYREDCNFDFIILWGSLDRRQGANRNGISENLFMQAHYELWDRIIANNVAHGRPGFVDSCASGGGRNDLETVRRSVPVNRSDADRNLLPLRLSMSTTFPKWLPYGGNVCKEGSNVVDSAFDIYISRCSYSEIYDLQLNFYMDREILDYDAIHQGLKEWKEISRYLLKDFYVLTPYHGVLDDNNWTAYMYYDRDDDSGVIQAFRQAGSGEKEYTLMIKAVDPDKFYSLNDLDGTFSVERVSGKALREGLTLRAENPRTAFVIYINPSE